MADTVFTNQFEKDRLYRNESSQTILSRFLLSFPRMQLVSDVVEQQSLVCVIGLQLLVLNQRLYKRVVFTIGFTPVSAENNCTFPYTFKGQLFYSCIPSLNLTIARTRWPAQYCPPTPTHGCMTANYTPAVCNYPSSQFHLLRTKKLLCFQLTSISI